MGGHQAATGSGRYRDETVFSHRHSEDPKTAQEESDPFLHLVYIIVDFRFYKIQGVLLQNGLGM